VGALCGTQGLEELHRLRQHEAALIEEVERLRGEKEVLLRQVWLLQPPAEQTSAADRGAKEGEVERRAREDLEMIRPGETVFRLPEASPLQEQPGVGQSETPAE
jgi:cell division protein FtsB